MHTDEKRGKMVVSFALFSSLFVGAFGNTCYNVADPCTLSTYQEIPYMITRDKTVRYFGELTNRTYCDQYQIDLNVWYRSDFNITTECVDIGHCGTINPVWVNGTIPSQEEGVVNRTACKSTATTCCERTYSLTMKNCGSYTTYCFIDVPTACYQRYCFDVGESASNATSGDDANTGGTVCPSTAIALPNVTGRSVQLDTLASGGVSVNDESLDDAWFNTQHGNTQYLMADSTNVPLVDSCGAFYPIYLQDPHPDQTAMADGSEVSVTACLKKYHFDCVVTYDVKIRKCGQGVEYFLVTTLRYAAYCFDIGYNITSTTTSTDPVTTAGVTSQTASVFSTRASSGRSTAPSDNKSDSVSVVSCYGVSPVVIVLLVLVGYQYFYCYLLFLFVPSQKSPSPVVIVLFVLVAVLLLFVILLVCFIAKKKCGKTPEKNVISVMPRELSVPGVLPVKQNGMYSEKGGDIAMVMPANIRTNYSAVNVLGVNDPPPAYDSVMGNQCDINMT